MLHDGVGVHFLWTDELAKVYASKDKADYKLALPACSLKTLIQKKMKKKSK